VLLFAESNTRFLCEVPADREAEFLQTLAGVPVAQVGRVVAQPRLAITRGAATLIETDLSVLKEAWQAPLRW
jgi:phosphoribosylformylglycinamidine synthase